MKTSLKLGLGIVAGCLAVWGGGGGFLWFRATHGPGSLAKGIADYRKAGLPWTATELQPPAPPDEDGGPILDIAFQQLASLDGPRLQDQATRAALSDDYAKTERLIAPFAPAMKLIEQGLKRPRAVFPHDWDLGPEVVEYEVADAKCAVWLFCDRSLIEAHRGDDNAADRDLLLAWALTDRFGPYPELLATLMRLAGRDDVYRVVQRIAALDVGRLDREVALQKALSRMTSRPNLKQAMRGEAYRDLATLRNIDIFKDRIQADAGGDSTLPPIDPQRLRRSGNPSGVFTDLAGGALLESLVRLNGIVDKDGDDLPRLAADLHKFDSDIQAKRDLRNQLANMMFPVFGGCGDVLLREAAISTVTRAFVEAMIFRARTGQFPTSLGDLPTAWIDPCDGKPLRFKRTPGGFRIYSIGPDLIDGGGLTEYETRSGIYYDIVAMYPPLTAKPKPKP